MSYIRQFKRSRSKKDIWNYNVRYAGVFRRPDYPCDAIGRCYLCVNDKRITCVEVNKMTGKQIEERLATLTQRKYLIEEEMRRLQKLWKKVQKNREGL